jgi:hypothetical protein
MLDRMVGRLGVLVLSGLWRRGDGGHGDGSVSIICFGASVTFPAVIALRGALSHATYLFGRSSDAFECLQIIDAVLYCAAL